MKKGNSKSGMPGTPPTNAENGENGVAAPPTPVSGARTLAARLLSDAKNGRSVNIGSLLREAMLDEAQVKALLSAPDQAEGNTALMLAAKNGHVDTVLMLVDLGADVDALNRKKQTALDLAAIEGRAKVVEALKKKGASDFPVL